ncbi:MAG: hypothetical protein FJZ90_05375 [Chloroflexi bacterium]|nr:hypothetical protein [Chloroflexota bacterium]
MSGTFQIYRLLKKHAIFIGEKGQVYGVLGLLDNLEDVLLWRPLPVMAKAVLLPFKGQIIYDGLMITYSIYFGSGIRSTLHEAYMAAKQSGRIITSLEPDVVREERPARRKPEKDWGPLLDDLVQTAEGIKGGPAVQSSAFGVLRASARLAQAAAHRPQEHEELRRLAQNVAAALTRLRTALEREERYPAG